MDKVRESPSLGSKEFENKTPDSLNSDSLSASGNSYVRNSYGRQRSARDIAVNIKFRNISYSVKEGFFKIKKRKLLNDVNGDFYSSELTAMMGPSGAGKSTLMDILAGYTTRGVTGQMYTNEKIRNETEFRKQSCYIMQNDHLQPHLTVYEAMIIAANLKFSNHLDFKQKDDKVREILESMDLLSKKKTKTMALSGGQKKRLSISLELITNPQVMFFDEPTSGLDSVSSKQCILLLKKLASSGRTIICTIHQPSAKILEIFDHLYVIANGTCMYQGDVERLLPYLSDINLTCPTFHNPADFLLEVLNGDHNENNCDYNDILEQKSENGLNQEWRRAANSSDNKSIQPKTPVESTTNDKRNPCRDLCNCYATSFLYELFILIGRTFLIISRDRTLTYNRISTHLLIGLFIGVLYFGIGREAADILNNFKFMFFSMMFLMLTSFNCVSTTYSFDKVSLNFAGINYIDIKPLLVSKKNQYLCSADKTIKFGSTYFSDLIFPSELPIITREHFNKWYSLKSYYLALTLADIPLQITATLIYGSITYFLTMQPIEVYRLISFLFMCVLISLVSQSFGLLIGASMDVKNGVIIGPFCLLPFTIFSGFFVQLNACHSSMRWLFHISFLKYGFEGLALSVFGYERDKLPCNKEYCHFVQPNTFLRYMGMENATYLAAAIFLIGLFLLIRISAYFMLSRQVRKSRNFRN